MLTTQKRFILLLVQGSDMQICTFRKRDFSAPSTGLCLPLVSWLYQHFWEKISFAVLSIQRWWYTNAALILSNIILCCMFGNVFYSWLVQRRPSRKWRHLSTAFLPKKGQRRKARLRGLSVIATLTNNSMAAKKYYFSPRAKNTTRNTLAFMVWEWLKYNNWWMKCS